MELKYLTLTIENKIAQLTINRPEKANSMNEQAWTELKSALLYCDETPDVRVIVFSGAGEKLFCGGIDLTMLMSVGQKTEDKCEGRKREKFRKLLLDFQEIISTFEQISKPVLSAVHGGCIGAGLDMISATDMRYCTKDAYFCIKEIDLGMVADIGTLQRLPKIIPDGLARELAYTGRNLTADEALQCGLVNRVFEDKETMLKEVSAIAALIATKSPLSVRGTKRNIVFTRDHSVNESLEYMANWNSAFFYSNDLLAAFQASMTRQSPTFED
ncbi:MAG: crotonase/enoyl-CoA hydratase family protein [Chitinophagales bacterium]